jgi:nicotinamide mononucleotide transporter
MFETYSYIEIAGALFGFICVLLSAKENIWCWPTGIVSVVLYGIFYYQQTLYASMYLQIFFLVFCILGWYQWLYGGENKTILKISNTPKKHLWKLIAITLGMFVVMGFIFDTESNDELPYLDSLVTAMSFTAQWMMNNKYTESWLLWIVTDIIYSVMHFQLHNFPSFLMYVSYVISASAGYYLWRKTLKSQQVAAH